MRISDWSSDVCSSDLSAAIGFSKSRKLTMAPALRPTALQVNERMTRIDQFDEAAAVYMSIDLRGADIGMPQHRSEEHTSELQSLMRNSYAVLCLKQKKRKKTTTTVRMSTDKTTSKQ